MDARARTLEERLAAAHALGRFATASEPTHTGIIDFWASVVAGGDADALARRLSWDDRTPAEVVRAAEPTEGDPDAAWIGFLVDVLDCAAISAPELRDETPEEPFAFQSAPPFVEIWIPFVRAARQRVWDADGAAFAEPARRTLEGALLADLAALGQAVLFERFASARESAGTSATRDARSRSFYGRFVASLLGKGLGPLFADFPVLGRLAVSLTTDWAAAVRELAVRLKADRVALEEAFGAAGEVTAVSTGLSDRHCGGRRIVILTFASGARVVYKPRTVGLEAAWNGFLGWLAAAGAPDAPPALRFIVREGYGWAEFAAHGALPDGAAAEAYFRSAGGLLAVAWLLGARDLHMDNVVATLVGPVVVDAEAVLQPDALPLAAAGPRGAFDAANAKLGELFSLHRPSLARADQCRGRHLRRRRIDGHRGACRTRRCQGLRAREHGCDGQGRHEADRGADGKPARSRRLSSESR